MKWSLIVINDSILASNLSKLDNFLWKPDLYIGCFHPFPFHQNINLQIIIKAMKRYILVYNTLHIIDNSKKDTSGNIRVNTTDITDTFNIFSRVASTKTFHEFASTDTPASTPTSTPTSTTLTSIG